MDIAEKTVNSTLDILKKLGAETRFAHVLGKKALIFLHKKQTDEARNILEQLLCILKEKQAKPFLSEILIDFGLALGGTDGEKYFVDGLKILLEMNAPARITRLKETMENRGFQQALKFVRDQMEEPADEKLEITAFGGLSVKRPNELKAVTGKSWPSRKSRELLALLLVLTENRQVTREILASHLWPEATEKKSLANLRVALTHLNHVLRGNVIISDGPFLALNRGNIQVDFWEFNSLSKQWQDFWRQGKPGGFSRQKNCRPLHAHNFSDQTITLFFNVFLTPAPNGTIMNNKEKRICPKCNFLGTRQDNVCPYCGIRLISLCPECGAPIRIAFARYCYRCGVQFSKTVDNRIGEQKNAGGSTPVPVFNAMKRPTNNQEEK